MMSRRVSPAIVGLTTVIGLAISGCVEQPPVTPPAVVSRPVLPPTAPVRVPDCRDCETLEVLEDVGKAVKDTVEKGAARIVDFSKEVLDGFQEVISIEVTPNRRLFDTIWVEEFPVTLQFSGQVVGDMRQKDHEYFTWRLQQREKTGVFTSEYMDVQQTTGDTFTITLTEEEVYKILLTSVGMGDDPSLYTTSVTVRKKPL